MDYERYNYIVLDSVGATYDATNNVANWDVPNYFYTEYQAGDKIFIELLSSVFSGPVTTLTASKTTTVYMNGPTINNQRSVGPTIDNQRSTNTQQILSIIPGDTTDSTGSGSFSSSSINFKNMILEVNRFNKIGLSIVYEKETVDIVNVSNDYRFILKVSYRKQE